MVRDSYINVAFAYGEFSMSGFLTNGTISSSSGSIGSAVDGVTIGRYLAALSGTNFSGTFPLEEGRNTISVLATNQYGGSG